jgi:hypothetical protein
MIIEETTPNIRQFHYRQEKTDKDYGSCLWANITLDCDNYTLMVESDCGNYTYGWCPTPEYESFIHLMCRIEKDYLLDKISSRCVLDIEQSKKETIDNVLYNDYILSDDDIESINDIDDFSSDETFYKECDDILRSSGITDTFELMQCVKRYPAGAITFADIFCDVLQPILQTEERKNEKRN